MKKLLLLLILSLPLAGYTQSKQQAAATRKQLKQLASELDWLRKELQIPGLSAAVVKDQQLVWATGFGYSDLEQHTKATANTPYRIASLTKPIATTLFLQLLEQGKVALDDPLKKYYPKDFETERVHVRHILTHTAGIAVAGGKPGDTYAYSGSYFGYLGFVITSATGQTFRDRLVNQILEPLHMDNSVPGQDVLTITPSPADSYAAGSRQRYEQVLNALAKPYTLYGAKENVLSPYPPMIIGSSAGLISTVTDLAKFDIAIDQHKLIRKETQELAWTPSLTNAGQRIPYGLGWFVQEFEGNRLIWHYGQWPVFSGLILKLPEKNLTLILLANSTGLSGPFDLDKGDILTSPFALAFLRAFVPVSGLAPDRALKKAAADSAIQRYLNSRLARVRKEVPADAEKLDLYTGKYALSPRQSVVISKEADRLSVAYPGQTQSPVALFSGPGQNFFAKIADVQLTFLKDRQGQVDTLLFVTGGKEQRAVKVK